MVEPNSAITWGMWNHGTVTRSIAMRDAAANGSRPAQRVRIEGGHHRPSETGSRTAACGAGEEVASTIPDGAGSLTIREPAPSGLCSRRNTFRDSAVTSRGNGTVPDAHQ